MRPQQGFSFVGKSTAERDKEKSVSEAGQAGFKK